MVACHHDRGCRIGHKEGPSSTASDSTVVVARDRLEHTRRDLDKVVLAECQVMGRIDGDLIARDRHRSSGGHHTRIQGQGLHRCTRIEEVVNFDITRTQFDAHVELQQQIAQTGNGAAGPPGQGQCGGVNIDGVGSTHAALHQRRTFYHGHEIGGLATGQIRREGVRPGLIASIDRGLTQPRGAVVDHHFALGIKCR